MVRSVIVFVLVAWVGVFAFSQASLQIGDTAPGGGIIFGEEGGRYLEAAPNNVGWLEWDNAVSAARSFSGGGFHDWFLPNKDQLYLLFSSLFLRGQGDLPAAYYWSSTESSSTQARAMVFSNQFQGVFLKSNKCFARPIRYVDLPKQKAATTGETTRTDYKIGDTGPAGGIIFAVSDGGFLEVAPNDFLPKRTFQDAVGGAKNFRFGGFEDWRVPTKSELRQLWKTLKSAGIGNFSEANYWSSTPSSEGSAWTIFFATGEESSATKMTENLLRPVRGF